MTVNEIGVEVAPAGMITLAGTPSRLESLEESVTADRWQARLYAQRAVDGAIRLIGVGGKCETELLLDEVQAITVGCMTRAIVGMEVHSRSRLRYGHVPVETPLTNVAAVGVSGTDVKCRWWRGSGQDDTGPASPNLLGTHRPTGNTPR